MLIGTSILNSSDYIVTDPKSDLLKFREKCAIGSTENMKGEKNDGIL